VWGMVKGSLNVSAPDLQTEFPTAAEVAQGAQTVSQRLNVINYVSVKFDQQCSPKSKKLLRAPLYRSKRCEQKLMLSVAFTWTQTLTTGTK